MTLSSSRGNPASWLAKLCGCLLPAALPPLHMVVLMHYWPQYARRVDRRMCTCGCWDTIFKGTYETGLASYKHLYFNATRNTFHIWLLTVLAVIALYESVRYIINLSLQRQLRYTMALLFATVIFSHYYSWWSYVNYWNDDFYVQWGHQLFFSCTELVSTVAVMRLADRRTELTANGILPIVGVASVHVLAAGKDQFVANVFAGEGSLHQVVRDLAFMFPDLLHLVLPLLDLCLRTHNTVRPGARDRREFTLRVLFLVAVGLTICSLL